jgi:hypothetical protein
VSFISGKINFILNGTSDIVGLAIALFDGSCEVNLVIVLDEVRSVFGQI